jgi:hypothetical protein
MLQEVALWAEVLGGLAVIGGVIFGIAQLRLFKRERADRAAIEVVRSMLSEHFPSSYRLLNHLPDGLTVEEVRKNGPEYEEAVFRISSVFETLGFKVFRGMVPLETAHHLVGGVTVAMWRKLERYMAEMAEAEDQGRLGEWFEWLVNRLEEFQENLPPQRASVRFERWKG